MLFDILLTASIQLFWNLIIKIDVHYVTAVESVYLDFDNLPDTNFSCDGKVIGGYYADIETGCQMFHVCTLGQKEISDIKFLCLNGTVFDQQTRVCEREDEVDCSKSETFFSLNLDLYGSNGANSGTLFTETSTNDEADDENEDSYYVSDDTEKTTKRISFENNGFDFTVARPFQNNTPSTSVKSNHKFENFEYSSQPFHYSNVSTASIAKSNDIITTVKPYYETNIASLSSATDSADITSQLLVLHEAFKKNLLNDNVTENSSIPNRNGGNLYQVYHYSTSPSSKSDVKKLVKQQESPIYYISPFSLIRNLTNNTASSSIRLGNIKELYRIPSDEERNMRENENNKINLSAYGEFMNKNSTVGRGNHNNNNNNIHTTVQPKANVFHNFNNVVQPSVHLPSLNERQRFPHGFSGYENNFHNNNANLKSLSNTAAPNKMNSNFGESNRNTYKSNNVSNLNYFLSSTSLPSLHIIKSLDSAITNDFSRLTNPKLPQQAEVNKIAPLNTTNNKQSYDEQFEPEQEDYYYY